MVVIDSGQHIERVYLVRFQKKKNKKSEYLLGEPLGKYHKIKTIKRLNIEINVIEVVMGYREDNKSCIIIYTSSR